VPEGSENLRAIATLYETFHVPVGLSDHGADTFAVPMAVAMGASLFERHIVLAAGDGSIDAGVSSTPEEFSDLIRTASRAALALGTGEKCCLPAEEANRRASRRGLYAVRSLPVGHVIGPDDVIALRPLVGLDANQGSRLIGARLSRNFEAGMPFLERDLHGEEGSRHVA
jgi:N-acetylneuraminate synthase